MELISPAEFRERMKISRSTQQRMIKRGELKAGFHFLRMGYGPKAHMRFNWSNCKPFD